MKLLSMRSNLKFLVKIDQFYTQFQNLKHYKGDAMMPTKNVKEAYDIILYFEDSSVSKVNDLNKV